MNVLVTGAHGLIGGAFCQRAEQRGWRVAKLLRTESPRKNEPTWDPSTGRIDLTPAGSIDAVIHLAGETVAQRWSPAAQTRIRQSRVQGTAALVEALHRCSSPPRVLLAASAIGIYGDRGDEWLDEASAPGAGFLADVCQAWEAAARPLATVTRVVHLRFGIVLSRHGGALAKMLPVFRFGLGGRLGSGRQFWSWVTLNDVLGVIDFALEKANLAGAINVVAPHPVTNGEFVKALGRQLRRPTFCRVPRFIIEMLLRQMGREVLLSSARVRPARLLAGGFEFAEGEIDDALSKEA